MKIADPEGKRYQVPESVLPRPAATSTSSKSSKKILFKYSESPFSFSIVRKSSSGADEVLFDTGANPIIFEPQYLRVKTGLPTNPNIYGLGEHTETFRLPSTKTTRTLWARDAYGIPTGTNLYGSHPIYFDHRSNGNTHGVFLLNSNGMDIKLNTESGKSSLEYNVIGGIIDLYILAGPSPVEVAQQYAEVVGLPAEVPYWSFGFHQCRYGYQSYVEVQDVISNYASAGIPMETMWTDSKCLTKLRLLTLMVVVKLITCWIVLYSPMIPTTFPRIECAKLWQTYMPEISIIVSLLYTFYTQT